MYEVKLEKADGENTCSWCFARDDTVQRHVDSDTYWHERCVDAAGDTVEHIIDWLPAQKRSRS